MRADAYVTDFVMKDSTRDKKAESAKLYEKIFGIHLPAGKPSKPCIYQNQPDLFKVISDSLRSDEKVTRIPREKSRRLILPQ